MDYRIQNLIPRLMLASLLLVAAGTSAPILSLFEGRIGQTSKADGYYDLRLQFWDRSVEAKPRLFQTIEIPHVQVKSGCFGILLDAGMGSFSEEKLMVKIQSRAFESWTPFEPANISRCELRAKESATLSGAKPQASAAPLAVNTPPL